MQGILIATALIASFIPQRIVYENPPNANAAIIVLSNSSAAAMKKDAPPDVEITEEVEVLPATKKSVYCSCMLYLQSRGIITHGDAIEQVANYDGPPYAGIVVLLRYRDKWTGEVIGHAALVEKVFLNDMLISEANYEKCNRSERQLRLDDAHIIGYMKP